jgi:uncharacterized protein (DUF342 family)
MDRIMGTLEVQNYPFTLSVSEDTLAVRLDYDPGSSDPSNLLNRIEEELKTLRILPLPTRVFLEKIISQGAQENKPIEGFIIAQGESPIPPKNGRIIWDKDFFSSAFAVDEKTGAIDYRCRSSQSVVGENQRLCRVKPPTSGTSGKNVFGKRIPVEHPDRIKMKAGANVREEEHPKGLYFYAIAAGRVRWLDEVLAVDDVYTIEGDVGLETGDIIHPGAVLIEGDLLSGSQVEAEGDVKVHGTVEAATIKAGGNLTVRGGISGGVIKVK